jgi:hypothetical protein
VQSAPSTSSAANLNPGNIARVRGFGIETIYQPGNSPYFDLVTGDGKIGALVSPSLENSFFGNRSVELDSDYLARRLDNKQYPNKKLNFGVGSVLINKEKYALDLGISVKRNPDIKKINLGAGLSARLMNLTFGVYSYKDDVKLTFGNKLDPANGVPYFFLMGAPTYQESFTVNTYTAGFHFDAFAMDIGSITTQYKFYPDPTKIMIYSASYTHKNFLFNFAHRIENSDNPDFSKNMLIYQRKKVQNYFGVQYLANKHIVIGGAYNYFLLNELSANLTIFF